MSYRSLTLVLLGSVLTVGALGSVSPTARALDGVTLDAIEFSTNNEGWASFGTLPAYRFDLGQSVAFQFSVGASRSVPAGFSVELTGDKSPTLVNVVQQLREGVNIFKLQLPTFNESGQKRVRMWGDSIEMPTPSSTALAKYAGETIFNVYNKAKTGDPLPPLPPQRPNVVTISLEARERDTKSTVQLLVNGSVAVEVPAGQSQVIRVPAKATVLAVVNVADGEEFNGWTTVVLPPYVTPCAATATSCQVFGTAGSDTIFGAQLTAQVSKKVVMSKLTLAQVGAGNIVMIKTEPQSSPVTVCSGCAATTYEFPLGTVVELGAVDAAKTGRWSSTDSFCGLNIVGDLTRCKGELPETPVTATATFTQCSADTGPASLLVGDVTAPQCATVTVNKLSREGATGSVTETGSGTLLGLSCGATCSTKSGGGLADGRTITLTATPTAGFFFSGWSGVSSCGTSPTCSFAFDSSKTLTATFSGISITPTDRYSVSYSSNGTGSSLGTLTTTLANGTHIDSGTAVNAGTVVTFTANIPSASGKFISWGGACSGSAATCTVTVNGNTIVSARFEKYLTATIVSYPQLSTYGKPDAALKVKYLDDFTAEKTLECATNCGTQTIKMLASGARVRMVVTPNAASEIAKWTNGCVTQSASDNTCELNPSANVIMRAELKIPLYTVTLNALTYDTDYSVRITDPSFPEHQQTHVQTAQCIPVVNGGCAGVKTFANVHKGQRFYLATNQEMKVQGCDSSTPGSCYITVNSNRTVTASFTKPPAKTYSYTAFMDAGSRNAWAVDHGQMKLVIRNGADDALVLDSGWCHADQGCYSLAAPKVTEGQYASVLLTSDYGEQDISQSGCDDWSIVESPFGAEPGRKCIYYFAGQAAGSALSSRFYYDVVYTIGDPRHLALANIVAATSGAVDSPRVGSSISAAWSTVVGMLDNGKAVTRIFAELVVTSLRTMSERMLAAVGIGSADLTPYDLYQTPEGAAVGMPVSFFGSIGNIGTTAFSGDATSTLQIEQSAVNNDWLLVGRLIAVSTSTPARQFAFPAWKNLWSPKFAGKYRARFCVATRVGSESNTANNCSLYREFSIGSVYTPPKPPMQRVDVTAAHSGTITSTSNTSDANFTGCKSSCNRNFRQGAILTITATPDAGKRFVRFDGLSGAECSNANRVSNRNVCSLTVNAYKAVTAVFAPADTLTLCGDADRSGTVVSSDSLKVLDYAVNIWRDLNLKNSDANGDGKITSSDASLILKAATGSAKLENVGGVCKYTLL